MMKKMVMMTRRMMHMMKMLKIVRMTMMKKNTTKMTLLTCSHVVGGRASFQPACGYAPRCSRPGRRQT